jgi:hypothetical protein
MHPDIRALASALVLTGLFASVALAEPGPRERACMVGEQRIGGECVPTTRGARNKGDSDR